jgi:hypothetical protein
LPAALLAQDHPDMDKFVPDRIRHVAEQMELARSPIA